MGSRVGYNVNDVTNDFLKGLDLFGGLSPEHLDSVGALARRETFKRGEGVFRERDPGGKFYVVESGVIEISRPRSDGRPLVLMRLERGEILGEMALFDEAPRGVTATAAVVPETHLLAWEIPAFQTLLAGSPALAAHLQRVLLKKLGQRLRASSNAVHALMRTVDSSGA